MPAFCIEKTRIGILFSRASEIAEEHDVIVTHGNGPQVGLLALEAAALDPDVHWPLDILDAESEGMIGYVIEQELMTRLPGRRIATLLTQVAVAADDAAFAAPSKPIGPLYKEADAKRLEAERHWHFGPDGDAWRRLVPSPLPLRILEISTIRHLVAEGIIVICCGGGGIPVTETAGGGIEPVEGVIDKDRTAALLAKDIGADALLLLTDVDAVYEDWGGERPSPIGETDVEVLAALSLDAGSMGPKVEAACRFVSDTGGLAGIGRLEDGAAILEGRAGTRLGGI